ncbi:hypothetical protein CAEBREN_30047 [Caenorhabditis brenneri]|uniref:Uncharacterized protein n=1 Tax=Caenorhabditis brenneri TaxID=135651 RepID=G0NJ51_CAEBE|nr:hypothetical protein CAEBREN_30047 [Caenorhabditis brenneri]
MYLKEQNMEDKKMSDSTYFRILSACPSTKQSGAVCVDYFMADMLEAQEKINGILNNWHQNGKIPTAYRDQLIRGIEESVNYFRTDFRIHLSQASTTADHCMQHALSDPVKPDFQVQCDHDHSIRCDRCEMVKNIEGELLDYSDSLVKNAQQSCYHSARTLFSLSTIAEKTGVEILRYSFSEPQNGKSSCDRVASQVKRQVREYVDLKNDVTTPEEFFEAVTARPLRGVSYYLADLNDRDSSKKKPATITGMSGLYDFEIDRYYLTARRYFGIGDGIKVKVDSKQANEATLAIIDQGGNTARKLEDLIVPASKRIAAVTNALQNLRLHKNDQLLNLPIGWAIRTRTKQGRFSESVHTWLKNIYDSGRKGRKKTGQEVELMMKTAVNEEGNVMFSVEERLNWRQIQSVFSQLTRKEDDKEANRAKRNAEKVDTETEETSNQYSFQFEESYQDEAGPNLPDILWTKIKTDRSIFLGDDEEDEEDEADEADVVIIPETDSSRRRSHPPEKPKSFKRIRDELFL